MKNHLTVFFASAAISAVSFLWGANTIKAVLEGWVDSSECTPIGCGTSEGTKEQAYYEEVCDKACPTIYFETSREVCPENDSDYTSDDSSKACSRNFRGVKKYADEVTETYSIYVTYDKPVGDSNHCHRPTAPSDIPQWAISDFNNLNLELDVHDENCREEVTDTRIISCECDQIIPCEPTPTDEPEPTPTDEPEATPTEIPEATPSVSATPTPAVTQRGSVLSDASAPTCNDTTPPAPSILSVQNAGSNSVKVTWSKVNPANDYSILYGTTSGNYPYSVFSTGNTDNFTINGISSGCFVIKAVNGCAPGPESAELCSGAIASGQVLGASTMADTGGFSDGIFELLLVAGSLFSSLGIKKISSKE